MLLFSKDEIRLIAEKVGYAEVQSFSKSFKKHFGITPAVYRNKKEEILKKNSKKINTIMPFYEDIIIVLETKKVVYKTYRGDYYSVKVDEIWSQLIEEVESYHVKANKLESFGIIWDEPIISENITYNYDACLVIDEVLKTPNKKFKVKNIPSKEYAVFTHIGNYQSISKTYDKIFSSWLFTTDKEISEDPFLEFYTKHESHTENPNEYETEIYVPLKG